MCSCVLGVLTGEPVVEPIVTFLFADNLKMMVISSSLDTFGLRDLVVYFCCGPGQSSNPVVCRRPGPLALGKVRLTDRRAGWGCLSCR